MGLARRGLRTGGRGGPDEVRGASCPGCGVRSEVVPWARAESGFTRAFEGMCVYLAKHALKTTSPPWCASTGRRSAG